MVAMCDNCWLLRVIWLLRVMREYLVVGAFHLMASHVINLRYRTTIILTVFFVLG